MEPGPFLLLVAALALVVAADAYRTSDRPRLVVSVMVAVLVGSAGIALFRGPSRPIENRLQREFGSDWDCSSGAICVKRTAPPSSP